jgi:hypothetical protein
MRRTPIWQKLARTYGADEIVDFIKEDVVDRILDNVIKALITF